MVVHPARGHREDTLSQLLAPLLSAARGRTVTGDRGGPRRLGAERPGIVHRLDRDTSGLLVVARSAEALRRLQRALAERQIEREYLALVEGRPPARTGTIEAPIGRDPRVRTRMAVGGSGAREARTHFTLERALPEHLAAAAAPGHGTHPPDPRAPAGDRAPRLRRPRVRHAPGMLGLRAPVPARHPPGLRPSLHRRARRGRTRRCRRISQAALARAEEAILSAQLVILDPRGRGSRPCPERRAVAGSGSAPSTRNSKRTHTKGVARG